MTIFAIIQQPSDNAANLPSAVASIFKDNFLQVGDKTWLVASSDTAKQISDKLGVTNGSNGTAIIFEVGDYYGRANNNIWAWIKTKWEAKSG